MNKTQIKFFLVGIIVVSLLTLSIYNFFKQKQEGEYIHVAFIGPLNTNAGKIMSQSIQLYFDRINERDGINGKKLQLDLFDDNNECSDEGKAGQEARKIVQENKAIIVIGHWYSGCSIAGGKVYKENQIPAIAPGSVGVKVTQDNEWYFRSIFTSRTSGPFLANYIKKVFRQDNVTIIHEDATFGLLLAQSFEEATKGLNMTVKHKWNFDPGAPNIEEIFKTFVDQLAQDKEEAGTIFLSVQSAEGTKLVKLIRDAGLHNIIVGETSFAEQDFADGFKEFPKEKATPGFYTNDIYAATPLIFDTANQKAQEFRDKYREKYHDEPDWSGAYAYDTALVLVKALKEAGLRGSLDQIQKDRQKLRDHLAKMTQIHDAVEGATGFNYFDENRDSPKPVILGVWKNNKLVSALTQFQLIRNLSEIADLEQAQQEEKVLEIDGKKMYKTNVVYVGVKFNEISEFDQEKLTCKIDFYLWFRFQGGFQPQDVEFLNAVDPTGLQDEKPVSDKLKDQITYRVYRLKREFKVDFGGRYIYKQHTVGITFRHRELTRNNLIYVTDELGMGMTAKQEGNLQLKQMIEDQVLSPSSGWRLDQAQFFQDIVSKNSLGDPDFLNVQTGTVEYSKFNALVHIKKSEVTLRGLLPYSMAYQVLILSSVMMLLLATAMNTKKMGRFSKLIWFFQAVFALLLLLAGEIRLVEWLAQNDFTFMLKTVIKTFDLLWWIIPAFFLNLAAERFIWTPLEQKTGRVIPNIVRLFMAFIIYFLAIVGIIAFVYEQPLTSVLATSGVIAMIIGLAIQINISNIFSGIAINIERPFRIGDWVQIASYDEGQVVDITWRSTRLKTRAECILSIPNSIASESAIVNFCYPDEVFWLWPTVYVHPMHPPERVKKILLDALLSAPKILKDPSPVVILTGINEWAASYWIAFCANDYANKFMILEEVWTRVWFHLNRSGIAPAVQRQEIHWFKGVKERGGEEATKPLTLLQEVDIFKPFATEAKRHLSERMRRHRFSPGEVIVQQGDKGDSLFIIVEGVVKVQVTNKDGLSNEVARLGAGNIFGEMALLTGEQRTATVVAIAETVLYEITKEDIAPFIAKQPEVSELISRMLAQRQLATQLRMNVHHDVEKIKEDVYMRFLGKIENFFGLGK